MTAECANSAIFVALNYAIAQHTQPQAAPSVRPSVCHKPVPREDKMLIRSRGFHRPVVHELYILIPIFILYVLGSFSGPKI